MSSTDQQDFGLYRPPKKKLRTTLYQKALHQTVKNVVSGRISKANVQKTLPPMIKQQVVKQVKTTTKRKKREQKVRRNFIKDIDEYFSENEIYYSTPLWLLNGFGRLVDAEYNQSIIENFVNSKRKFQKVGSFNPIEYVEGEGPYSYYFVKHKNHVYLSVYDFEKVHIFSMKVH